MTIPKPVERANALTRLSTPLATIGVYVALLRERFKEGVTSDPALPYVWRSLASGDTDLKNTDIFIENGWNENIEARNVRPGIWIDREQTIYGRLSIGDQDQIPVIQNVRLESFYCPAEIDITVDCTALKRGESMMIGSIVQDFLHMSSRIIMLYFNFRDISPTLLGKTTPFEKDTRLWTTAVTFRASYENRWATMPAATAIHEITLRLADVSDPDLYFREIALRSSEPPPQG